MPRTGSFSLRPAREGGLAKAILLSIAAGFAVYFFQELTKALVAREIMAPVHIANDADAIAAGVAATRGKLDKLTRVWTIGKGIGCGN